MLTEVKQTLRPRATSAKRTVRGTIFSAAIVLAASVSAGIAARQTVLYPRTDDAEVLANFIGMAPVVERGQAATPRRARREARAGECAS